MKRSKIPTADGQAAGGSVPKSEPVPENVDVLDDGTILEVPAEDPALKPSVTKQVLINASGIFVTESFQAEVTDEYASSTETLVDGMLLHLDTPADIQMLAHTANANTELEPAVRCLVKLASVIKAREPRALEEVDTGEVTDALEHLLRYRRIHKAMALGATCVEAGITHYENFLDGAVRKVYPHLEDLIASNRKMADLFDPMTKLVMAPVQKGQETKAEKAALTEQVKTETLAQANQAQGTTGPTPGAAPSGAVGGGAPSATPAGAGTPAVKPTLPSPKAIRAKPRAPSAIHPRNAVRRPKK